MLSSLLSGLAAGMVSTVTFHAAAWEALYSVGLISVPPYSMILTNYGIPFLLNLAILRGLWGVAFGFAFLRVTLPAWLIGLSVGVACGSFEWPMAFVGHGHWTMTNSWALYLMQASLLMPAGVSALGLRFGCCIDTLENCVGQPTTHTSTKP